MFPVCGVQLKVFKDEAVYKAKASIRSRGAFRLRERMWIRRYGAAQFQLFVAAEHLTHLCARSLLAITFKVLAKKEGTAVFAHLFILAFAFFFVSVGNASSKRRTGRFGAVESALRAATSS